MLMLANIGDNSMFTLNAVSLSDLWPSARITYWAQVWGVAPVSTLLIATPCFSGVDEMVSRRRLVVERTAAAVSRPRATSRPRRRRAAPAGHLLRRAVPSDMVAELRRQASQPPFAAARSEAPRLAQWHLRVPLHVPRATRVSDADSADKCIRNVRRDGKNDPRGGGYD